MGEIGTEGKVLVVRSIHVTYHLRLAAGKREAAERAHSFHKEACPVAMTLRNCVEITTRLEIEELPDEGL